MKIRMLVDRKGSPDGVTAVLYRAGEAHDLPPDLAVPWLAKGYCEQDKMMPGPSETKNETPPKEPAGDVAGKSGRRKK